MADNSGINWTDATWNPVTGCTKVSSACKHCYAERDWARLANNPKTPHYNGRKFTDVATRPEVLEQPLRWTRPRRIFVNSMSDLFHEAVPNEFIDKVLAVMLLAPWHTFQVLTKRPKRMLEYMTHDRLYSRVLDAANDIRFRLPNLPNVGISDPTRSPANWIWFGVTAENQESADERIPLLLQTPAAVRFVSCEPLLGYIDFIVPFAGAKVDALRGALPGIPRIDLVIGGGESGPKARPMHPHWIRSLRNLCLDAGVPFIFKQHGEWLAAAFATDQQAAMPYRRLAYIRLDGSVHDGSNGVNLFGGDEQITLVGKRIAGRLLDGREHLEFPEVHR